MSTARQVEICQCCGAKRIVYVASLSNGLVSTLKKFARAVKKYGRNSLHYENEAYLTHKQGCNISKLGKFGLLEMTNKKSGYWQITQLGYDFLNGRCAMPKQIKVFRNERIGRSEEEIMFEDFPEEEGAEFWQREFQMENPDHDGSRQAPLNL